MNQGHNANGKNNGYAHNPPFTQPAYNIPHYNHLHPTSPIYPIYSNLPHPSQNAEINTLKNEISNITQLIDKYFDNNDKVYNGIDKLLTDVADINNKFGKNVKWCDKTNSKIKTLNTKINVLEKQIRNISRKSQENTENKNKKRFKYYPKHGSLDNNNADKDNDNDDNDNDTNDNHTFDNTEPVNNMPGLGILGSLIESVNNSGGGLGESLGGGLGEGLGDDGDNDKEDDDKCINSEDEYDYDDGDIFVNDDDIEIDNNFVKLDSNISTIDDIIELGMRFDIPEEELVRKVVKKPKQELKRRILVNPITGMMLISNPKNAKNDKKEDVEKEKESVVQYDSSMELYKYNDKYYSIDPVKLARLVKPLAKLKRMVGLNNIKDTILNFVTHYLQQKTHNKMLHTVIEGPPGVGKTRLGKILAEIYSAMGVIPSSRCKIVTSNDLIGQYQGHTIKKTQKVLDEAEGGVLFIDEAYTLGSTRDDSYSRICINCINENLDKKRKNLIVIFAGYAGALEKLVFSQNEGLRRRFPFKYEMTGYNNEEMKDIFISFVRKKRLKLDSRISENDLAQLFKKEKNNLNNFGGDLENIINKCQMLCDRERFGDHPRKRNIITLDIINKSMSEHIKKLGASDLVCNNMYS